MIPARGNYTARFHHDPSKPAHLNPGTLPVEAFSDNGEALVVDHEGFFVPAFSYGNLDEVVSDPTPTKPAASIPTNQAAPQPGSVLTFTVDTRWSHGVFNVKDDEPIRFPFLGWATQVVHNAAPGGCRSELVPVFPDEPVPVTLTELHSRHDDIVSFQRLIPVGEPVS